jgi:aryl-alcohol dehydrogenase-like predicted oxidoreductase
VNRRDALKLALATAAGACAPNRRNAGDLPTTEPGDAARAATSDAPSTPPAIASPTMTTRPIPRSGEAIPVIGLGTWQTFDVGDADTDRAPLREVVTHFFAAGGRVIDSSPMYGNAETVTGDLVSELAPAERPFLATKVWTTGKREGIAQMKRSMQQMRTDRIDLMQIHNLVDWKTHLPVLREWKQAGTIRYIGITHYAHGAFEEMEQLIRTEQLDFVQLPYNLTNRAAEQRLLPAAKDTGTAVLVMRPFAEGALFGRVKGKALPGWAADIDCTSWAQLFLKFILGHPAVTCPIPATSNPKHVVDNVQAGMGRLPDEPMRAKLIELLGS